MNRMKRFTAVLLAVLVSFGIFGAITAPSAEAATASATRLEIAKIAKSYQGKVQYAYGQRNESKLIFDCSSFTQFVFKKAGIHIGWGATAQTKFGDKISSASNLKIGDLIIFSKVGNKSKIGHVGIYVGQGKFVHNLNPANDVITSDLTSTSWKNRFMYGIRVVK
ncbi:MAG: C40 family peptidase [Gorillibacterium sp.]|nr:C40 family peptidase [Gorillibacterium sp.]